jgi:hypothetical protein
VRTLPSTSEHGGGKYARLFGVSCIDPCASRVARRTRLQAAPTLMNIALIVGCARSGTSILGELIAHFSGVKYVFEAYNVWDSAGVGDCQSHRLEARHATSEVIRKLRQWAEHEQGGAQILVEKCPRNCLRVPFLREVFPEAKFIHIVRDGRDVTCSLVPGIGGVRWAHLRPPSWQELMNSAQGAVRCALAWRAIMEIALSDLAEVPHLLIRYEDLVRDPVSLANKCARYLGTEAGPEAIEFCEKIQDLTHGSYQARRQTRWYEDNHRSRVGRWRDNLPASDRETILEILDPIRRRLGYEP